MTHQPATNLLVPGRGHAMSPDGTLSLTISAMRRVDTAERYYHRYADEFEQASIENIGGVILMAGGYAKLATGDAMPPPPHPQRESTLMYARGRQAGIPDRYLYNSSASTSTLENVLRAQEEGFFTAVSADNPLGIVTQESQWDRLNWFARKVFKLPQEAVQLIPAPGEDDPSILRDERKLFQITKIVYGPAKTPAGLRRAESVLSGVASTAVRLGLQKPPAQRYTTINA